jgi:hypothetical protein
MSGKEYPGVQRAFHNLRTDYEKVSGKLPEIFVDSFPRTGYLIIAGTIGRNELIDQLIERKKIDVGELRGKWESTLIQVVKRPFPGIKQALVIAGSDKRGTIFGIYEISAKIGVSPWHFWADMPVRKHAQLWLKQSRYTIESPKVKYRGIFINDEAPALSGWVADKFGGFNHQFYETVFDLILRLKGNFLWPAMWGRAFYDDDPLNPQLADEYGVVIGTSHHEPMMRAHDEWRRFGTGKWNYEENTDVLQKFWAEGIKRKGSYESIVTVGMRGDGDAPMSESSNIALLEKIIGDQRTILQKVTGMPASETPQGWALYKEVQDYYDKGMRVPDDVTLLLCDDNWGNVRKLPKPGDAPRKGGYGMYYHFDYVGGPRNYKWLNTNQVERVWEQMNLCYQYGVDRIWVVNTGDIKPMELPIEFFLDFAWNPEAMPVEKVQQYAEKWSEKYFGKENASEIGRLMDTYSRFNSRRKPELLSPETYSLLNYREAEKVVDEYNQLAKDAEKLYRELAPEFKDAYYQLVLFPIQACANLNDLYYTVALNRLYAGQGRASTNEMADKALKLYQKDSLLSRQFNHELAQGKWNHMMDQTHIGYTYWQEPRSNKMPHTERITVPEEAQMRLVIEGSNKCWMEGKVDPLLPTLDPFICTSCFVEVVNAGAKPFDFALTNDTPWLISSKTRGQVTDQERITFKVDWNRAPKGKSAVPVRIESPGNKTIEFVIQVFHPENIPPSLNGFMESNGVISIEAAHYSRKTDNSGIVWKEIPGLGRTLSGMTTFPVNTQASAPSSSDSHLEYDLFFFSSGNTDVTLYVSPTLNYNGESLKYAVSLDNEPLQVIDLHGNYANREWEEWVRNNIITSSSKHTLVSPGKHILKLYRVDPGVVIQKIVIDTGGLKPSYLGPPESLVNLSR